MKPRLKEAKEWRLLWAEGAAMSAALESPSVPVPFYGVWFRFWAIGLIDLLCNKSDNEIIK